MYTGVGFLLRLRTKAAANLATIGKHCNMHEWFSEATLVFVLHDTTIMLRPWSLELRIKSTAQCAAAGLSTCVAAYRGWFVLWYSYCIFSSWALVAKVGALLTLSKRRWCKRMGWHRTCNWPLATPTSPCRNWRFYPTQASRKLISTIQDLTFQCFTCSWQCLCLCSRCGPFRIFQIWQIAWIK
jgi:hypothetical protein